MLAELRKKTGYTFANCKKALETNNNDLAQVIEIDSHSCFRVHILNITSKDKSRNSRLWFRIKSVQ